MKITQLILLFLLSFISCKRNEKKMPQFVRCLEIEEAKIYEPESEPPFDSIEGLVSYCREKAQIPVDLNFFNRNKKIRFGKIGAFYYGINEKDDIVISYDLLGIVISTYPTKVVSVDPIKKVIFRKEIEQLTTPIYTKKELHFTDC